MRYCLFNSTAQCFAVAVRTAHRACARRFVRGANNDKGIAVAWTVLVIVSCGRLSVADDQVSFNRDVRPILSDKCFFCHGPDAAKREAELRLDVRDVAVAAGAINPESPNESELLRRIASSDPEVVMPPLSAKVGRSST